jgi:aminoglycoside phosphotransferase (APT) family kinase protein
VTGSPVGGWSVLHGGASSAMYALELDGAIGRAVLRCYVSIPEVEHEPDLARREAEVLQLLTSSPLPTPELIAVDPDGSVAGVPAVVMSWLPGRALWDARGARPWVEGLAEVLPEIHDVSVVGNDLRNYSPYAQKSYEPPKWATDRRAWERAVEHFHEPPPDLGRSFIHRDFHPGNVLWTRGRVNGVVDWQSGCAGPPSVDIGHCRANLLLDGSGLAELFTVAAEQATGRPYHPWADIACFIGMLDHLRSGPPREAGRRAIDRAISSAVANL